MPTKEKTWPSSTQGSLNHLLSAESDCEGTEDFQSRIMKSGFVWSSDSLAGWAESNVEPPLVMHEWIGEFPAPAIRRSDLKKSAVSRLHEVLGSTADYVLACFLRSASDRLHQRVRLDERTLTDPEQILVAFESPGLSDQTRRMLALFAETLKFDERQQLRLLQHLWDYVVACRASHDEDELVALGSAIRKLIAYWPAQRMDELATLLAYGEATTVHPDIELEVAKGLVYRFSWDTKAVWPGSPRLCESLFDLATFHSSKRSLENAVASAIAVNSIIALAFLKDDRSVAFVQSLPKHSLPWFISLVNSRSSRLLTRLQTEQRRSTESLGLLPEIVRELAPHKGK